MKCDLLSSLQPLPNWFRLSNIVYSMIWGICLNLEVDGSYTPPDQTLLFFNTLPL